MKKPDFRRAFGTVAPWVASSLVKVCTNVRRCEEASSVGIVSALRDLGLNPSSMPHRSTIGPRECLCFPRYSSIPQSARFGSRYHFGIYDGTEQPDVVPGVQIRLETRSRCGSIPERSMVPRPIRTAPARGYGEPRSHNRSRDSRTRRIPASCASSPTWLLELSSAVNALSGERSVGLGPTKRAVWNWTLALHPPGNHRRSSPRAALVQVRSQYASALGLCIVFLIHRATLVR